MKKVFAIIFLTSISYLASAQHQFGVKGGVNLAKEKFSNKDFKTSPVIGFHAGLAFRYIFLERMAAQAELLFSMEGSKEESINNTKGTIQRMYLHLPLVFQYMIMEKLRAEAGLQAGYMLSAKEKFGDSDYFDIMEYYKKIDARWLIGLAYSLNQQMILNARYTHSFSKINKHPVGGGELRSMVFYLGLLYLLK